MNRNAFSKGDKVLIKNSHIVDDIYGNYALLGRVGKVVYKAYDDACTRPFGVVISDLNNKSSSLGCFWLDDESLKLVEEGEEDNMKKELEGYNRVAFVTIENSARKYAYALYDDDIQPTDYVLVTGQAEGKICFVGSICSIDDTNNIPVTEEVICKVDLSAYRQRQDIRRKKQKLLAKMKAKRRELEARKLDEMYASIDDDYAKMLAELKSIG
jgi:hypothetical protein